MAEKAERIEPPAQPAMVSVVVDRSEPRDYLGGGGRPRRRGFAEPQKLVGRN